MQDRITRSYLYRGLKMAIQRASEMRKGQEGREERFAKFAFSESELTADLRITAGEYAYVEKRYAENIDAVVKTTEHVPTFLMTVASNLRWNDPDEQNPQWLQNYLAAHGQQNLGTASNNSRAEILKALDLLQKEEQALAGEGAKTVFGLIEKEGVDSLHFRLGKIF